MLRCVNWLALSCDVAIFILCIQIAQKAIIEPEVVEVRIICTVPPPPQTAIGQLNRG